MPRLKAPERHTDRPGIEPGIEHGGCSLTVGLTVGLLRVLRAEAALPQAAVVVNPPEVRIVHVVIADGARARGQGPVRDAGVRVLPALARRKAGGR